MRIAVLIQFILILASIALGTWCVNYDLGVFHKHIPVFWAFILNVFTGGQSITIAVVLKVLKILGVVAA